MSCCGVEKDSKRRKEPQGLSRSENSQIDAAIKFHEKAIKQNQALEEAKVAMDEWETESTYSTSTLASSASKASMDNFDDLDLLLDQMQPMDMSDLTLAKNVMLYNVGKIDHLVSQISTDFDFHLAIGMKNDFTFFALPNFTFDVKEEKLTGGVLDERVAKRNIYLRDVQFVYEVTDRKAFKSMDYENKNGLEFFKKILDTDYVESRESIIKEWTYKSFDRFETLPLELIGMNKSLKPIMLNAVAECVNKDDLEKKLLMPLEDTIKIVVGRPGCGKSSQMKKRFEKYGIEITELNNDIPTMKMPGFAENFEKVMIAQEGNLDDPILKVLKFLVSYIFHEPNSLFMRPYQIQNLFDNGIQKYFYHSNVLFNSRHFRNARCLIDKAIDLKIPIEIFTIAVEPLEARMNLLEIRLKNELTSHTLHGGNHDRALAQFEDANLLWHTHVHKLIMELVDRKVDFSIRRIKNVWKD